MLSTKFANFNRIFASVDGVPALKERLSGQIQTYADTFAQWALASSKVRPWVVNIDTSSEHMLPEADKVIASARARASSAAATLSASQWRTRNIIVAVGCAAILIGLGFSWRIGRSITRPLNGLADVMKRLSRRGHVGSNTGDASKR